MLETMAFMSTHNLIIFLSILVLGSFVINHANAEQSIPDWVKNKAGWCNFEM